ncbi:MAG TPA: hypothetical protein VFF73_42240 [Planctomycetota bacterium]|nr:hypothetical protein [Planctomycetota bacterium]
MSSENKITIGCECGKRYRVPSSKAGKKIACKACGARIEVPRETALSERSRGNILASLGIDPTSAEEAYKAEVKKRESSEKVYVCTRCESPIPTVELKKAYVKGELICLGCQAAVQVEDRKAERENAEGGKKRAAVELISDHRDPVRDRLVASGYGALMFVGVLGPAWAIFGLRFLPALGLGLVAGIVVGALVLRSRS